MQAAQMTREKIPPTKQDCRVTEAQYSARPFGPKRLWSGSHSPHLSALPWCSGRGNLCGPQGHYLLLSTDILFHVPSLPLHLLSHTHPRGALTEALEWPRG